MVDICPENYLHEVEEKRCPSNLIINLSTSGGRGEGGGSHLRYTFRDDLVWNMVYIYFYYS